MLPLLQLEYQYRYRVLDREQRGVEDVLARVARFEPEEVEAASADVPGRVAALAAAFDEMIAEIERAEEIQRRAMQVQLAIELLTFAGSLRGMVAMRGPSSPMAIPMPAMAGAGGCAVAVGQVVVSAEWIAAIKHLVEIGAITAAGAADALRVRGFTSAMAQASDLPQSVKDLLGEGPTTDAMKVTNTAGAGVARTPRHHVLPQEERAFFEEREFKGDLDIDNFTVSSRPRTTRRSTARGGDIRADRLVARSAFCSTIHAMAPSRRSRQSRRPSRPPARGLSRRQPRNRAAASALTAARAPTLVAWMPRGLE